METSGEAGPRNFDAEAGAGGLDFELDLEPVRPVQPVIFGTRDLDEPSGFEAEPAKPIRRAVEPAPPPLELSEIQTLADYGPIPDSVRATPRYAYRVFKRQRQLKQELAALSARSTRADAERARCELLRRAIDSYDETRVRQGVRLACTLAALLLLLSVFSVIF